MSTHDDLGQLLERLRELNEQREGDLLKFVNFADARASTLTTQVEWLTSRVEREAESGGRLLAMLESHEARARLQEESRRDEAESKNRVFDQVGQILEALGPEIVLLVRSGVSAVGGRHVRPTLAPTGVYCQWCGGDLGLNKSECPSREGYFCEATTV